MPPDHWLFVDAAFRRSGVCRMHGTAPCQLFTVAGLDPRVWQHLLQAPGEEWGSAPSLVVVEHPYLAKSNADTAIKLGRSVGVVEAVAGLLGADVRCRRASQWQKHLGAAGLTRKAAKAHVRAVVRGLATHPDERPPVSGRWARVWMPGLEGVGLKASDQDRADAAGGAIGYAVEQGWQLPEV